ncbi:MAG: hypothetical protein ACD_2C00012G0001 [uncultured bacterium (gcode 4)]|uniref:Uncharacterized protein n=1 Tax=uncultured bacterium (gcode 4) TaxID=1234023 RepID=K2GIM2_9BACT|nr:MAG: hypothetical protein ACD_2C00012G0001 [uncultured bacterium (gcode 4)]
METFLKIRLESHLLNNYAFSSPEEIVKHFWCMQAQDIPQALWAVGSRIEHPKKELIRNALVEWKIIRSWPMRWTIHFVNPKNIHWMLELCASKTLPWFAKRRAFLWISDKDAEKALSVMRERLHWWRALTRKELWNVLKESWIMMQTQWTYHLACYAATRWLICFWPPTDKEETFVLLDEWAPKKDELSPDEQLYELAKMYVTWHWPATAEDLAWWCWLWMTQCRKAISLIRDECEVLTHNLKEYLYYPTANHNTPKDEVRLLWWFDEYFLWYKDRRPVADIVHHPELFTINWIFFPLVIRWWMVIWSWKRTFTKNKVSINISILEWYELKREDVEVECRRYADFYDLDEYSIQIL